MAPGIKTGGRKKGVPNKTTSRLKGDILAALDKAGGVKYLAKVAKENPGPFLSLLGKILPTAIANDPDHPITDPKGLSDAILAHIAAGGRK